MMNATLKDLVTTLLRGGTYLRVRPSRNGKPAYMLYSGNQVPVRGYSERNYKQIHDLTKKDRIGRITLDLRLVRQMDGRSFVKKRYRQTRKTTVTY